MITNGYGRIRTVEKIVWGSFVQLHSPVEGGAGDVGKVVAEGFAACSVTPHGAFISARLLGRVSSESRGQIVRGCTLANETLPHLGLSLRVQCLVYLLASGCLESGVGLTGVGARQGAAAAVDAPLANAGRGSLLAQVFEQIPLMFQRDGFRERFIESPLELSSVTRRLADADGLPKVLT